MVNAHCMREWNLRIKFFVKFFVKVPSSPLFLMFVAVGPGHRPDTNAALQQEADHENLRNFATNALHKDDCNVTYQAASDEKACTS